MDGEETFLFFLNAETGKRAPNSSVKGSGANHYPRALSHAIQPDTNLEIRATDTPPPRPLFHHPARGFNHNSKAPSHVHTVTLKWCNILFEDIKSWSLMRPIKSFMRAPHQLRLCDMISLRPIYYRQSTANQTRFKIS